MVQNKTVQKLLFDIGVHGEFKLTEIKGGRNNRGYKVDTTMTRYFLKEYFRGDDDSRNRLLGEFEFCSFVQSRKISEGAKVLICDADAGIALFEYIDGVKCSKEDLTLSRVLEAARFFNRLNQHKNCVEALTLNNASEACFNPMAHLKCVSRRIEKLSRIPNNQDINAEVLAFVQEKLSPSLESIEKKFHATMIPFSNTREQRFLSPSDFGFHNMLIDRQNRLRFVDFEYAGWDHPVKMICDFFCQPRLPVPIEWLGAFIEESIGQFTKLRELQNYIPLFYSLYRLKWCCIILNEFLPEGKQRRSFSANATEMEKQKRHQLRIAEDYFSSSPIKMRKVA